MAAILFRLFRLNNISMLQPQRRGVSTKTEQAGHDVDNHLAVAAPVGRPSPSDHSVATSSAPEVEDCEDLEVVEVRSDESETNIVGMTWTTGKSVNPAADCESFTQVGGGLKETSGRSGRHCDTKSDSDDKPQKISHCAVDCESFTQVGGFKETSSCSERHGDKESDSRPNDKPPKSSDRAGDGESFTMVGGLKETSCHTGSNGDKESDSGDKASTDEEIRDTGNTADKPAVAASQQSSTRTGVELSRDILQSHGNSDDDDDDDNDDDGSDKDGPLDTAGKRSVAASHQSSARTGSAANGDRFRSSENSADRDADGDDGPLDTAGKPSSAASNQTSIQTGEAAEITDRFGRPQNHAAAAADSDFDDDDDDDAEPAGVIAKPSFSPFSVISASAGGDHHQSSVAQDDKNSMENKTGLSQDMKPDHDDVKPVPVAAVTAVAAESSKSPVAKDQSFYGASSDDEKASDDDDDDDDDDDKGDGVCEKNREATIPCTGASNSLDDVFAKNLRDSPPQTTNQDGTAVEAITGGGGTDISNSGVALDVAKAMEGRVATDSDSEEQVEIFGDKNAGGGDRNDVNTLANSPAETQPASWEASGKDAKHEVRILSA